MKSAVVDPPRIADPPRVTEQLRIVDVPRVADPPGIADPLRTMDLQINNPRPVVDSLLVVDVPQVKDVPRVVETFLGDKPLPSHTTRRACAAPRGTRASRGSRRTPHLKIVRCDSATKRATRRKASSWNRDNCTMPLRVPYGTAIGRVLLVLPRASGFGSLPRVMCCSAIFARNVCNPPVLTQGCVQECSCCGIRCLFEAPLTQFALSLIGGSCAGSFAALVLPTTSTNFTACRAWSCQYHDSPLRVGTGGTDDACSW